jgi:hypothetical protein
MYPFQLESSIEQLLFEAPPLVGRDLQLKKGFQILRQPYCWIPDAHCGHLSSSRSHLCMYENFRLHGSSQYPDLQCPLLDHV